MAAFDASHTTTHGGRIGQMFVSMFSGFSAWNDARVTRKALSSLTDRELDDIGLNRGDIDVVSNYR
ncbi:DUF1127 domain-containing protein [Mesobacterium sp. TK19101]|uniref:DUF1127 domain-containing protein n=1 Tax=Mesobacterium hydrothermale TaxID=3111907 RepID=A0ABU6HB49_9RHOB|nr:DUF1127 domain-containing protein [Mesobacterium sp. TK19101]MEC3859687.1 DUF1127 domain-containing protein [Mesobacterium sp. TK19101]